MIKTEKNTSQADAVRNNPEFARYILQTYGKERLLAICPDWVDPDAAPSSSPAASQDEVA